eukprot:gene20278-39981_t
MFVRVNTTSNSPRQSVQIVESKRDGHKVKTKILRHVGIALNENELEKLKFLAYDIIATMKHDEQIASGQKSLFPDLHPTSTEHARVLQNNSEKRKLGRKPAKKIEDILPLSQVTLDKIIEEKRIVEGVGEIAGPIYNKLGFNDVCASKKEGELLKSLVLARLVAPKSKKALQKILDTQFDKKYELDAIYRLMDRLHPQIDRIKSHVFKRCQTLFPVGINLMLFDVTTLYFESVETDNVRQFGYSKDHRFNTTQ